MNIFYTNSNPYICAKEHCNVHQNKMIIEYAQMLSSAHRILDGTKYTIITPRKKTIYELHDERQDILYKATHINHPCSKWIRISNENYQWVYETLYHLCKLYYMRNQKHHKTSNLLSLLSESPMNIPIGTFTTPPKAMPDEYKIGDTISSYKNYLCAKYHDWLTRERKMKVEWYISKPNWVTNVE